MEALTNTTQRHREVPIPVWAVFLGRGRTGRENKGRTRPGRVRARDSFRATTTSETASVRCVIGVGRHPPGMAGYVHLVSSRLVSCHPTGSGHDRSGGRKLGKVQESTTEDALPSARKKNEAGFRDQQYNGSSRRVEGFTKLGDCFRGVLVTGVCQS